MAKQRHRLFEIYEFRDEATCALTPKKARPATEGTAQLSWTLKYLTAMPDASVTHVKFRGAHSFGAETLNDLRKDFAEMEDRLVRDSRVLFDFTGVESFCAVSIGALDELKQQLRNKGSRIVLCCLGPTVHQSFLKRSTGRERIDETYS